MADINLTLSVIILKVNRLNVPLKPTELVERTKKHDQIHTIHKKDFRSRDDDSKGLEKDVSCKQQKVHSHRTRQTLRQTSLLETEKAML